jgi:hypothetical protein
MKKVLIALGVFVLAALALPIVGNSVIQNSIDTRITELQSYGLESKKRESDSNYLTTKVHFEFLLKDADAFITYLNTYADNQIPPYVNAMLEGVVVGVDVEYSNFPFADDIKLDIYPMALSLSMMESLKEENLTFYQYLEKFLAAKGILYHINYNIATQNFDGFVKDIDENQTIEAQTQLTLQLEDLTFAGKGDLFAPQSLATSLKKFHVSLEKEAESFRFVFEALKSKNEYLSKSNYSSDLELEKFNFSINAQENNMEFLLANMKVVAASNTAEKSADVETKTSVDEFKFSSQELNIEMSNAKLAAGVHKLDKISYEALLEIISKLNKTQAGLDAGLNAEMQSTITTLLSKGLHFEMKEFSVEKILLDKNEEIGGFFVSSDMKLKEDADFAQKMQLSPLLLASNIELLTNIKISQNLYELVVQDAARAVAESYLKKDAQNYIFDISYKDGVLKVNDKPL